MNMKCECAKNYQFLSIKNLWQLLLLLLPVIIAACGGGGGGGDAGTSFTGTTNPAEITSDNIASFAEGVTGGLDLPFLFNVDVSLVAAAKATVSAAVALPPSEHYEGSCGGTLDITFSSSESSSHIEVTGKGVAVNYCEDGTISTNLSTDAGFFDGTFTITMGQSLDRLWENVSLSFFSVRDPVDGLLMELDGSINMTWPVGDTATYLENIVAKFTDSGVVSEYWLKDFKLERDNSGLNMIITGRVYYGEEGYVWLETTAALEPLSPSYLEVGPAWGAVVMHGETADGRLLFGDDPANKVELWNGSEWADMVCFDGDWSRTSCTPPIANAGSDQFVATGNVVQLDGSGSSDEGGDLLSYNWTFQSRPAGSNAILSDMQAMSPTFIADVDGVYVLNLTVNDGLADSDVQQVTLTAQKEIFKLDFQVTDAEYSKQLDRLIMVSTSPANRLHIHDSFTGADTAIDLPLAPSSVSVGPDGLHAAVGHNGWISYVNLSTATVGKTFAVSTDVLDIVLAGNGYVYAFPRQDQWAYVRCVNIVTEVETLSIGRQIYAGTLAKLHPSGTVIYGANNGLSPSDIEKYDISSGTADYLYDSPYHGDYPMCGDLWLSEDGLRVFTRCGNVFRSSTVQSEDMLYNGSLSNSVIIEHLSHSSAANKVIAIPEAPSWPPDSMGDTELHIYDYDFLTFEAVVPLPSFVASNLLYPAHGKYVFFSSAGSNYFVIVQADDTAGMLNDFGIVVY